MFLCDTEVVLCCRWRGQIHIRLAGKWLGPFLWLSSSSGSTQNKIPVLAGWRGFGEGGQRSLGLEVLYEKPELQMAWKTVLWGNVGFRCGAGCGLDKQSWALLMGCRQFVVIRNVPLTPLSLCSPQAFLSSWALPSCSWSWLSNNDCQPFKRAPVSNTVKAREAEGKAEICGNLQGFYCESETRKDICTVQCR